LLNRTPAALVFKLGNLRSLDKAHTSKGLTHGSKTDRQVWHHYINRPYELVVAYEESLRMVRAECNMVADSGILLPFSQNNELQEPDYAEQDSYGWTPRRKRQWAFRHALLFNYKNQCCLSGFGNIDMLLASHIVPWSKDDISHATPKADFSVRSDLAKLPNEVYLYFEVNHSTDFNESYSAYCNCNEDF